MSMLQGKMSRFVFLRIQRAPPWWDSWVSYDAGTMEYRSWCRANTQRKILVNHAGGAGRHALA